MNLTGKPRLIGYRAGINLGLWLSQNVGKSHDYLSTFITREDVARIASWGMDHVRLPGDHFTFEEDASPGVYKKDPLFFIDQCLAWRKELGLNIILDLHVAPVHPALENTKPKYSVQS